jgi:hypothetical protein
MVLPQFSFTSKISETSVLFNYMKVKVMSLDFQQVKQQVTAMGEGANKRVQMLSGKRQEATRVLKDFATELTALQSKLGRAISVNSKLRCAIPTNESLDHHGVVPPMPESVTILAADGSQINPDRHASVDYCLVNVGAIQLKHGTPEPPTTTVRTRLLFDDQMYTATGRMSERMVALVRDLGERRLLADLAQELNQPVVTLTDGPLELWEGSEGDIDGREYQKMFDEYLAALHVLFMSGASTAGYIDRPRGDLLVRLLEVAMLPEDQMERVGRDYRPYLGVTDVDMFYDVLKPGERSAIFGIQTKKADKYPVESALHFFYLNVGRDEGHPYPVRVEVPAWVVHNKQMVNDLHAVLVQQCRILGTRTYPYLLHRSHEVAVVTQDEKMQLENMIALELHARGLFFEGPSQKQTTKDLVGRTRM